jgi:antibiotic biosynthesis monooxygenase (ABM) superfamily enzyme
MEMTMQSIEHVTFRLVPATDRAAFLAAARATEAAVRRQPGFRARMLVEAEDGTWSEIVTWASHADAMAAAKAVMSDADFAPFGAMIDGPSVRMTHSALVWQIT